MVKIHLHNLATYDYFTLLQHFPTLSLEINSLGHHILNTFSHMHILQNGKTFFMTEA